MRIPNVEKLFVKKITKTRKTAGSYQIVPVPEFCHVLSVVCDYGVSWSCSFVLYFMYRRAASGPSLLAYTIKCMDVDEDMTDQILDICGYMFIV